VQLCEQQYDQIIKKLPMAAEILNKEEKKVDNSLKEEKNIDLEKVKFEILHGDKYVDMWSGAKWVILKSFAF